jgi:transposase
LALPFKSSKRLEAENAAPRQQLIVAPSGPPVVALTYRATVDVPARFRKSKSLGAVFGLTCSRDQSGERDRPGAISRCGDEMMRAMLYEAAQAMLLRSAKWSWLKAWALAILEDGARGHYFGMIWERKYLKCPFRR